MIWIINALLIWFFTVAFTAKARLELMTEKEVRKQEKEELERQLYIVIKEKSDLEEEYHNYMMNNPTYVEL